MPRLSSDRLATIKVSKRSSWNSSKRYFHIAIALFSEMIDPLTLNGVLDCAQLRHANLYKTYEMKRLTVDADAKFARLCSGSWRSGLFRPPRSDLEFAMFEWTLDFFIPPNQAPDATHKLLE